MNEERRMTMLLIRGYLQTIEGSRIS